METCQQGESEESEIKQLKEWLFKISKEDRAYIKGASKALLYIQETDFLLPEAKKQPENTAIFIAQSEQRLATDIS